MNKRYKLLKNLPDANAGTIFTWDNNYGGYVYVDKTGSEDGCLMFSRSVENNPEWFAPIPEQKEQPKGEGVKALNISFESNTNLLKVFINKPINEVVAETGIDKLLERLTTALNNDTVVDDKVTREELLKAESDAFYAGRAGYRIQIPHNGMEYGDFNYHHKTFSDYKDSQNKKQ